MKIFSLSPNGNGKGTGRMADSATQFCIHKYIGEFFQGGFFFLEVVTFFVTLRADLEDYFKCKT